MFRIRRMTLRDKPALMDISSRIWEGTDYIPDVFDDWVRDDQGEFAAVLRDDVLVGCGKLTFLTPTDAWLEGMRKDPRVTEKGMADAVARHFLSRLAIRGDLTSLRFSTYFRNMTSITANERLGFAKRTVLSIKSWEGGPDRVPSPAIRVGPVTTLTDPGAVLAFLGRSGYFAATEGLVVEGWCAYPFSPAFIAERYVAGGFCSGILTHAGCVGAAVWTPGERDRQAALRIVFLDAEDDDAADSLFRALFDSARMVMDGGPGQRCALEWMVPGLPRLKRWAARWGLVSEEREEDFLVYEMPQDRLRAFR